MYGEAPINSNVHKRLVCTRSFPNADVGSLEPLHIPSFCAAGLESHYYPGYMMSVMLIDEIPGLGGRSSF